MVPDISHVKGIVLDLDFTLTHFIGGYGGLYAIFTHRGILSDVVTAAFEQVNKSGFSIHNFTRAVETMAGQSLSDHTAIEKEFLQWMQTSFTLYEDSVLWLQKWSGRIPIFVATFGVFEFQRGKVRHVEEKTHTTFNGVYVTETPYEKWKNIQTLTKSVGCPLLYVDDDLRELDAVREHMTQDEVITIAMKRSDGPVRAPSKYEHPTISSFSELTR